MRKAGSQVSLRTHNTRVYSALDTLFPSLFLLLNTGIEGIFSILTPVYQIAWQGPRPSQTPRFCWRHLSTLPIHCRPCVYVSYIRPLLLQLANRCGCRCNVRWGTCSIELKLFRSALGMGKIQGVSLYLRQF